MKGIVLVGGLGSRLYPLTIATSKQLLPIGDKPLVYYPLSVLMLAGIREIIMVCDPENLRSFQKLFGNGSKFGLSIEYVIQPNPEGIAQAFILAEDELAGCPVALILGDNVFYGDGFSQRLLNAAKKKTGATIFGYQVTDPQRFGVVEFDRSGDVISIEEKPLTPKSNYAITGLYFYDSRVVDFAKSLRPSKRGELEITDLNRLYLEISQLKVETLGRGFAWLDTGTNQAMVEGGAFINSIEARQGIKVACLEEIAFRNGWIDLDMLNERHSELCKSDYGAYIKKLIDEEEKS